MAGTISPVFTVQTLGKRTYAEMVAAAQRLFEKAKRAVSQGNFVQAFQYLKQAADARRCTFATGLVSECRNIERRKICLPLLLEGSGAS
jgi:hypothetical protein